MTNSGLAAQLDALASEVKQQEQFLDNLQEGQAMYFLPNSIKNMLVDEHTPELPPHYFSPQEVYPGTILHLHPHNNDVNILFDWEEIEMMGLPALTYPNGMRITTDVISRFQIKRERIAF